MTLDKEAQKSSLSQVSLDKWDYGVAIASGTLTALLDIFWVGEFSLSDARTWGKNTVEKFVIKTAQAKGYVGTETKGAIRKLEDAKLLTDKLTHDFGGGKQHHLRDFGHHPTVFGLILSVLTQFTGVGYGTDTQGNFVCIPIPGIDPNSTDLLTKVYDGTITWTLHLISDMAGSSNPGIGTGIPGTLLSSLKELSAIPGIKAVFGTDDKSNFLFSRKISSLFNGTMFAERDVSGNIMQALPFDLRTELGITYQIGKQALSVLINECIVRAFYAVRRFCIELERKKVRDPADIYRLDTNSFLPFNNKTISRMTTISSATFSVMEISASAMKALAKNGNNKAGFAKDFFLGINYIGIGRTAVAVKNEIIYALEDMHGEYLQIAEKSKNVPVSGDSSIQSKMAHKDALDLFTEVGTSVGAIASMGTPLGLVSAAIAVYQKVSEAVAMETAAREDRIRIEQECTASIAVIKENRRQMELAVSEYMEISLKTFSAAFDEMDNAILANDSDGFIKGTEIVQNQLGRETPFRCQSEFDALMSSDDDLKL